MPKRTYISPILMIATLLAGCSDSFCIDGGTVCWANRDQIVKAARKCGVSNLEPTKAGAAWAAYVPASVPNHAAKEDCIYADLHAQGLKVTR
jgi:hypothetical protein